MMIGTEDLLQKYGYDRAKLAEDFVLGKCHNRFAPSALSALDVQAAGIRLQLRLEKAKADLPDLVVECLKHPIEVNKRTRAGKAYLALIAALSDLQ